MIEVDCLQGSEEWFQAKLGIPSSSNFGKIITPGGKKSSSSAGYMNQLLADWLAGCCIDAVEANCWMSRGTDLEDTARSAYEFESGNEVRQVGFCYLNAKRLVGCSPDGLTGKDGCLEIKCPKASTLVGYYGGELPTVYIPQVQGQLWVTGRKWCEFYAWHPSLFPLHVHVERNDGYIKALSEQVDTFISRMLERRKELKEWRVK